MTELEEEQIQADAVIAGLVGSTIALCPECAAKTLSIKVVTGDREHPDEYYRCAACHVNWEVFQPEGQPYRPMTPRGRDMVPFDDNGNQYKWEWNRATRRRPNFVFDDTLTWVDNGSRSMSNFVFRRASTGTLVAIMPSDFRAFMALMVHGQLTGKFTFRCRGGAYGVTLAKEPKPRAPRKRRATA